MRRVRPPKRTSVVVRAQIALGAVAATMLVACGSGGSSVVRIGSATFDRAAVEHWKAAIASGASPPDPAAAPGQPPLRQAIAFLISTRWTLDEASALGLALSPGQANASLQAEEAAAPGGRSEFQRSLSSLGESAADAKLEIEANADRRALQAHFALLAAARTRQDVTEQSVTAYYKAHLAQYQHGEHRYYDLIEQIPSISRARQLARELGAGPRFAAVSVKEAPIVSSRSFELSHGEGAVLRAVYSAKLGVVVGPLSLRRKWALFVVRRVERAHVQTLDQVRASITRALVRQSQAREYAKLVAAYLSRWRARTDCSPGYVVPSCRQSATSASAGGDPFAGA
jgi:hypothetical protein